MQFSAFIAGLGQSCYKCNFLDNIEKNAACNLSNVV